MSYNKKAIAEALSKLNKARKPKQANDIIMDPEGQNKFPGLPTRIPSDNITMETTPYPVLGIDNLGNQQMMYPGANYLFPGADYVDEYPMAKYGGLVTGLTNTKGNLLMSSKGKRMMAKSGSLYATNKLFLGNPLVTKRKKAVFVPGHDFQTGGQKPTLYVDPNDPAGRVRYQAYQDSLRLWNQGQKNNAKRLRDFGTNKWGDKVVHTTYSSPKEMKIHGFYENDAKVPGLVNKPTHYKESKLKSKYASQASQKNGLGHYTGMAHGIYAKPKQPIQFQKTFLQLKQPVEYKPNPEVVAKQQQLIDAGYKIGKADGIWGDKSKAAWKEFQKAQTGESEVTPEQTPTLEVAPLGNTPQQLVQEDQPQAPLIPEGYNVWTHNGQPLDPQVYGYAPSTKGPRQISQFASTHALKRANESYSQLGATPWATTGKKLLTDITKPYSSKKDATNAVEQIAQTLGVDSSQLEIVKSPKGYMGYIIIQTLSEQRYGGTFQSGGTTDWKSRIASTLNYQKGGQKDKWGRSPDSKWYGFDPERKQYTLGNKAPKTPIKSQKNYFAEGLYQMANNQPSSETVDQSRGLSSKQQVEVKDRSAEAKNIKEQARQEYNRAAVEGVHPNMYADTRSDVQRQKDQEAASQLTDPTGLNRVKNMLQAPLFQVGNFWDYASGGDDWKQAQQDYNLTQMNPYVSGSEKALNFASTTAGLTGEGLMTGMDIIDGYALAKAIPGSGKYIKNLFSTRTPQQLPGSPNVISSIDDVNRGLTNTPQPWQMQELPGLHLKSTMEGEAISKIVEPKTGLINTEQALAIIGKESGGADKVALIRQGLGDNIPKKMDYNDFRKTIQDQLIPLEKQFTTHSSGYGIDRLGYGKYKTVINERGNPILQPLKGKNLEPIENQTLILGNKSKLGRGSSAHGNPEETLGHIHFLRDAEHPNIGIATQIQSDAFQGTHRIMPKDSKNLTALEKQQKSLARMEELQERNKAILNRMKTEGVDEAGLPVQDYQVKQFEDIVKAQEQSNLFKKADIENFTQKQLLDKNHQERFLQEFMDYAGKRGDLDYIAIPKPETAAKVQGYSKGEPSREFINSQTNLRNDIVDALEKHGENSIEFKTLNDKYNKLLKDNSLGNYSPEHQTILKKYSEYEKIAKKLGWKTEDITIKGNTYTKIQIPDKFKKGKGEIKAFGLAPFIGNPLQLADKIVPMLNPLGFVSDGMTPFFLSPLQQLSFYGKKLKGDNMAFRKFGNDLSHVQKTKTLDPSAGGWRMGKSKIINEGNWAAMRETNERYPGLFEATFDFNNPKTNLDYMVVPKRDGVLIVNKDRSLAPTIDLKDPGVSLNRRLPFSSRYVPINKEKLLNNQFQLATQLPYVQSLIEKYGIGAGWAAAAAIMGGDREILNNYLDLPKKGLDRFIENLKEQADKSGLNLQFQQGGTTNIPLPAFQDMELTDEEIEEYKRGGCTIVKL